MGCNPFGKLISRLFGGRGERPRIRRRRSRRGRQREYSPPPPPLPQYTTSLSSVRTAIYRDGSPIVVAQPVHAIQTPAPVQVPENGQHLHYHQHHPLPEAAGDILPSNHACTATEHEVGAEAAGCAVRGVGCYQTQLLEPQAAAAAVYRYAPMSPVASAAWEDNRERRREYFGGEYRYSYPTPMREGIYGIATDANRLTTMFSDENPNACSIV